MSKKITGPCPKCGMSPSSLQVGNHGPIGWGCGSGIERMFDPHEFVQSKACAEIARLTEAVRVRDKAATAGWGTLDHCQYCGRRGPTHPFGAQSCRDNCPRVAHPLEAEGPGGDG